jgi:iron complex outermembrane receptor protein
LKNQFGKTLSNSLMGASVLAIAIAAPAFAQAQTAPAPAPAPTCGVPGLPACPTATPAATGSTVVVTGSRIRRNSFNTPSSLSVIVNENAVLSGTIDAAEVLQGSTAAAGSTQINNFFTGFVVEGGGGIQTVGLNSLGAQRTLVLLNGRRLPPSGTRGQVNAVDLGTIPNLAISRYEILYEGASPIYGSDAVGGVVNGITRKDVNGFEIEAAGQMSELGGGQDMRIGALWGHTGDNWNVMIAAEYFEQKALKYSDFNQCREDYLFHPTTGARVDYINPATGAPFCLGTTNGGSFTRVTAQGNAASGTGTWIPDATSTTRVVGTNPQTGAANTLLRVPGYRRIFSPPVGSVNAGLPITYQLDYDSPFHSNADVVSPSQRTNFYGTFSRDLNILGGIEVYGEGLYAKRESQQSGAAQLFFSAPATNVYNPWGTSFGGTAAAQPVIARPANNEQTVETWQVVGGVRGSTGNGIGGFLRGGSWEIYGQTSKGTGKYNGTTIRQDRLNASLATTITAGVASCPTPTFGGTCLPINFFDPRVVNGDYTAAEYDYLFNNENVGKTVYEQSAFEANISGDVFQIPGASDAVKVNLGAYWREYSINDVPGVETMRNNVALTTVAGITRGTDAVKEVYGEIDAPLIARRPLIENLNLSVAYRYTNYDSYDSNTTWKATLTWDVTPQIRFVGMSGTSYRAPALFELFLGNQTGFLGQTSIDPCVQWDTFADEPARTRCAADGIPGDYTGAGSSATIFTGGGAGNLKEEESRSDIFSFVWKPTFANLNLRVDAWQIEVSDQVATFGASSIVGACYYDQSGKASYFCGLFTRDPVSHNILTVENTYVNINKTRVEGIDLKVLYRKDFSFGDLTVDSQHRWTTFNGTGLFDQAALSSDAGSIGDPTYVSTTQLRFVKKDWTAAWTINATGPASHVRYFGSDVQNIAAGSNYSFQGLTQLKYKMDVETTITHDFSIRYRSDEWTVVGAISNIFNEDPPSVSSGVYFGYLGTHPLASQYDFVGRAATLSITRRF